ncbi:MAG TPA: SpoIIE family protein phosphatase [Jatrophihabitans sp.]|nr:SpoIIE family protein phosphatase [Jatrophihabitans sp.]
MTDSVGTTSILLVEDDHGDAVLVQTCLSDVGIRDTDIAWSRTLGEALDELVLRPPGCVLLDLGLPDSEGYSAVHKMVAAAPDIAIIVLTGRQERDGIDALAAGAQDYLAKDTITGELLERSIRYARERKRAQRAQQQLREVRLSAAEQARLERGLLPRPRLRSDAVAATTYYRPGRDDAVLGGDFFDIVEVEDGRVRAVIGDVMGHGPDEAALGVHLRVAWRTLLLAGVPDDRILPALADLLGAEEDEQHYVTVCDVTIEGETLTMRLAGHPAPILSDGEKPRYLEAAIGPPLGVQLPGGIAAKWPETAVEMPAGSSLILYSDGLLDAYAGAPEVQGLGIEELVDAVHTCVRSGQPATSWIEALVGSAPRESIDDTAVVVLTTRDR